MGHVTTIYGVATAVHQCPYNICYNIQNDHGSQQWTYSEGLSSSNHFVLHSSKDTVLYFLAAFAHQLHCYALVRCQVMLCYICTESLKC